MSAPRDPFLVVVAAIALPLLVLAAGLAGFVATVALLHETARVLYVPRWGVLLLVAAPLALGIAALRARSPLWLRAGLLGWTGGAATAAAMTGGTVSA